MWLEDKRSKKSMRLLTLLQLLITPYKGLYQTCGFILRLCENCYQWKARDEVTKDEYEGSDYSHTHRFQWRCYKGLHRTCSFILRLCRIYRLLKARDEMTKDNYEWSDYSHTHRFQSRCIRVCIGHVVPPCVWWYLLFTWSIPEDKWRIWTEGLLIHLHLLNSL